MNSIELKYHPFMIILNICTGSCNILFLKICVSEETKGINVKACNLTTNKNEAKAMKEHISSDWKCKFNSTICNSNQKRNNKTCECECKNYRKCKKDYSWNRSICICENSKYLKSIVDTSVTGYDEIIIVMDIVPTKKKNTIETNITSITSINCHSKKVRHWHNLHTVLLMIIVLLDY